jgi:hypothetical protein
MEGLIGRICRWPGVQGDPECNTEITGLKSNWWFSRAKPLGEGDCRSDCWIGKLYPRTSQYLGAGGYNRHHTALSPGGDSHQSVASTANTVRRCNTPPCPISNKTVQTTPRSESTSCFLVDGFPRKMDQAIAFQENVNLPFKELN